MKYCKVSRKKILVEELAALLLWFVISIFPFIYIDTFSFWWWAVLLPPLVLYLGAALFYIPAAYRNTCYLINTSKVIYQSCLLYTSFPAPLFPARSRDCELAHPCQRRLLGVHIDRRVCVRRPRDQN